MDDVVLNLKVHVDEFRRVSIVGMNTADFRRSEEHIFRLLALEEFLDGCLVNQVKLVMRSRNNIPESFVLQSTHKGRADTQDLGGQPRKSLKKSSLVLSWGFLVKSSWYRVLG